jgi:hypothetical protein
MSDSHDSQTSTSSDSHEPSPPKTPNSVVLQIPTMAFDRSRGRNVHIYDAENSMLDIFIGYEAPKEMPLEEQPFLRDKEGTKIEKSDDPLQPGEYYIVTTCRVLPPSHGLSN